MTLALNDPQLELLPTHEMPWTSFERLLLRLAREVVGLRSLMEVGDRGQAQEGLDVVGINAADEAEGLQGKRYQKFTRADLDEAVAPFLSGALSVPVCQLYVGVSCTATERKVVDRVLELNQIHRPVRFELWDRKRISEMLRPRPELVREFFGEEAARRFCPPYQTVPVEVPGPGALTTANAVMQGPLTSSGAQEHLDAARALEESDPKTALNRVRTAQDLLAEAGFLAHAEVLDATVVTLLTRLGRADEATRFLLDRFWTALRDDLTPTADSAAQDLAGDRDTGTGTTVANPSGVGVAAAQIADAAVRAYNHPFNDLPAAVDELAVEPALRIDHARLLLLCAEIELASGQIGWLEQRLQTLNAAAETVGGQDLELQVRLRLVVADTTGAWVDLLRDARRRALTRDLAALVLARNARYRATRGDYQEADDGWLEAVEQACLAERHEDAVNWLHSRRRLAGRYSAEFADPIFPLVTALRRRPTRPPIAAAPQVHERALAALQRDKAPTASRRLRRYLRDAVVSGAWQDEHDARILLAGLYRDAGEPGRAADHLVLAGEAKRAEELGRDVGDTYLDVLHHLATPMYWVHATALRLIAAQADLLPDDAVAQVADDALQVLHRAREGTLVDTPLFSPSLYLAGHKALAALAGRLTHYQADQLLTYLAPLAPGTEDAGRFTDDDHAAACAAIGTAHPDLLDPALDQLLDLLARASHALKRPARDFLIDQLPRVRDRLAGLAARGNRDAEEILALAEPEMVTEPQAEAAYQALTAPLDSRQGVYAIGTNAIGHSHAAARLPADRRADLVRRQLERARSPYEDSGNRNDYLLAAANLADDLRQQDVDALFQLALTEATEPALSEPDALHAGFSHPLGSFRMTGSGRDSRPAAAFLAARLAANPDQRQQARDAALRLIGTDGDADYHVTRALQVLQDGLDRDVPFLVKQGWALRCLAAHTWARTPALPSTIGDLLTADPDPRVRRNLAQALTGIALDERTDNVRQQLLTDPRHSVRRLLQAQSS